MSKQPQKIEQEEPVDEKLTQLISYLDGELDDDETDLIERALINDPDMRSHADILSRTWGMLDVLEDVSASCNFTQSTLATISTDFVAEQKQSPKTRARSLLSDLVTACARYKVLPCFLAGVLGAAIGLMVSDRIQQRRMQSEEAAIDAIVLEHLDMLLKDDLYREVPDLESLKTLQLDSGNSNDETETP